MVNEVDTQHKRNSIFSLYNVNTNSYHNYRTMTLLQSQYEQTDGIRAKSEVTLGADKRRRLLTSEDLDLKTLNNRNRSLKSNSEALNSDGDSGSPLSDSSVISQSETDDHSMQSIFLLLQSKRENVNAGQAHSFMDSKDTGQGERQQSLGRVMQSLNQNHHSHNQSSINNHISNDTSISTLQRGGGGVGGRGAPLSVIIPRRIPTANILE